MNLCFTSSSILKSGHFLELEEKTLNPKRGRSGSQAQEPEPKMGLGWSPVVPQRLESTRFPMRLRSSAGLRVVSLIEVTCASSRCDKVDVEDLLCHHSWKVLLGKFKQDESPSNAWRKCYVRREEQYQDTLSSRLKANPETSIPK